MKNNKKGFTIVELVIVIAVIAILAAVLIPTFSNVIDNAHKSSDLQAAKTKFDQLYADDSADGSIDGKVGETAFTADTTKYPGAKSAVNGLAASKDFYYAANGTAVTSFVYRGGDYTITYTPTDDKWTPAPNPKAE